MSSVQRATHNSTIIIIDMDAERRRQHQLVLERHGFGPVLVLAPDQPLPDALATWPWALVLLDSGQDPAAAHARLTRLHAECPQLALVATGAQGPWPDGDCLRECVGDVLVHPISEVALLAVVRRLFTQHLAGPADGGLVPAAQHEAMPYPTLMSLIASRPDAVFGAEPLVLIGEDGCEGRHLAEEIHGHAGRSGPFAELPVAHADAKHLRQQLAECRLGTLYIAELAALSVPAQELLTRVLRGQAAKSQRNTRLIIAHEPSLPLSAVRAGLQLALGRHRLVLPALRTVPAQIPMLIQRILTDLTARHGWRVPPLPEALTALIARYDFPGNLRELRCLVTTAVQDSAGGDFSLAPFTAALDHALSLPHSRATSTLLRTLDHLPTLRDIQRLLIEEALRRTRNHPSEAAELLGISRQALHKRLQGRDLDTTGARDDTTGNGPLVSGRH